MKTIKVKELMVPLADYASVSQDANLYEAVIALEEAQQHYDKRAYKHRAVLVFDDHNKIVGKLSQLDVLKALEPKYGEIDSVKGVSHWGLSASFIKSMMVNYGLWQKPMEDICRKAADIIVKDIMYAPVEREYVKEDSTLNEAIHLLVMGYHQSLLVTRNDEVVGILRLTDVFSKICDAIKSCQL